MVEHGQDDHERRVRYLGRARKVGHDIQSSGWPLIRPIRSAGPRACWLPRLGRDHRQHAHGKRERSSLVLLVRPAPGGRRRQHARARRMYIIRRKTSFPFDQSDCWIRKLVWLE